LPDAEEAYSQSFTHPEAHIDHSPTTFAAESFEEGVYAAYDPSGGMRAIKPSTDVNLPATLVRGNINLGIDPP
jgi:hypothetical protein